MQAYYKKRCFLTRQLAPPVAARPLLPWAAIHQRTLFIAAAIFAAAAALILFGAPLGTALMGRSVGLGGIGRRAVR